LGGETGAAALEWCVPPAVLLSALVATTSRAALLSLAAGLLISLASRGASARRAGFAMASMLVFVGIATAFAGPARLVDRFARVHRDSRERLAGWSAARELWQERPLLGWGLGAYPAAVAAHPGVEARLLAVHRHLLLAPHNEYLRLGAELGAPAIVLVAWAASAAFRRARHDPWALASLAGLALHASVDFPFGVPALAALAALIAAPARGPDAAA
jgi:O-antigen ligase